MWSMVAQRLTQITPPAATPDQLWQRVEAAWSAVPQEHIQSLFESMPRIWYSMKDLSPHFTYGITEDLTGVACSLKLWYFSISSESV
ncbi:transposable element Tcb1 transposase [Trichonephila clavipes]|nr:transposable element Tcb1 transposase [Trichonephila clavipes]